MKDIRFAIEEIPELTDFGVGVYKERKLTPKQREAKFNKERNTLLNSVSDFEKTCEWLEQVKMIKSINNRRTSYGLKHIVERDIGYITNGVFIAAAICSGFAFRIQNGGPNVCFNMSERSIKRIVKRQLTSA